MALVHRWCSTTWLGTGSTLASSVSGGVFEGSMPIGLDRAGESKFVDPKLGRMIPMEGSGVAGVKVTSVVSTPLLASGV